MVTVKLGNWSVGFGTDVESGRKRPLALIILDGWGFSQRREGNAIALANTPNFDRLTAAYPGTLLEAAGARVGLTPGSPGNPEIGHLNIGTGRAVKSKRFLVSEAVEDESFFENNVLVAAYQKVKRRKSALHLVGLVSDAGIESSTDTLFALLRMAKRMELPENVFVHAILDGVDVPPRSADVYIEAVEIKLDDIGVGKLATICGRQYAMDNTENWQRTARAYTMLVHSEGIAANDAVSAIRDSFLRGLTDEFVQPIIMHDENEKPVGAIKDNDVVVFFNHRGRDMRQLVRAVVESETDQAEFPKPKADVVCLTEYDPEFCVPAAFTAGKEENVLADILASHEITNARFSEPERDKHLSYFFNGRCQTGRKGEQQIVVPVPESAAERPEKASFKLADSVIRALDLAEEDVFIVNLSAADHAARTGNLSKTIEAIQYVDTCLGGIIDKISELGGVAIVTSDHGNCEDMSLNGSAPNPCTSNPVPFYIVGADLNGLKLREGGALEDIAPTILGILGIEKPSEMTGSDLRSV